MSKFIVSMSDSCKRRLKTVCNHNSVSMNQFIIDAIETKLEPEYKALINFLANEGKKATDKLRQEGRLIEKKDNEITDKDLEDLAK